jgi:hypothetical protein
VQSGRALASGAARILNTTKRGSSAPSSGGGAPPRIDYSAMQPPKNPPSTKDNPEKKP